MGTTWIVGLFWVASVAASAWWSYGAGRDAEIASQVREDRVAAHAASVAASAAAVAISKIEVQRVEITQPVLREVREKRVYMDCAHTPDGLRGVNAALTGGRTEPAGAGQLPAASAPR